MTVFVTQQVNGRNTHGAREYGELKILFPPDTQVMSDAAFAVRKLTRELARFNDDDFILAMGDPVLMGAAIGIALRSNMGRAKVLKWDKGPMAYYPVTIDLNQKGESFGG